MLTTASSCKAEGTWALHAARALGVGLTLQPTGDDLTQSTYPILLLTKIVMALLKPNDQTSQSCGRVTPNYISIITKSTTQANVG